VSIELKRICLAVLGAAGAMAQITGDLAVKVSDASGGTVAAAWVSVTQLETGTARKVATDEAGLARLALLNVGRFEVRVEKAVLRRRWCGLRSTRAGRANCG
jgi:Carboxypeptidase regulatory-like domain